MINLLCRPFYINLKETWLLKRDSDAPRACSELGGKYWKHGIQGLEYTRGSKHKLSVVNSFCVLPLTWISISIICISFWGAAAVRAASKVAAAEARAVPSPSPRPATPQSQPSRPRTPQEPVSSCHSVWLTHWSLGDLTHWGRDKWTPFRRRHFQMPFLEWKCVNSD